MSEVVFRDLGPQHLEEAAELFLASLRDVYSPNLSRKLLEKQTVIENLEDLLSHHPGVAAFAGDKLTGFLAGYRRIPQFKGTQQGVYVPEWAHAARGYNRQNLYFQLYREISSQWSASGDHTHALTILVPDQEAVNSWFWQGFGMLVVDAVRGLEPIQEKVSPYTEIIKARLEHIPELLALDAEHVQYMLAPPLLMVTQRDSEESFTRFLETPGNAIWLASVQGKPAAYFKANRRTEGAADIVCALDTFACTGAYTRPEYRGLGLAPILLGVAIDWAREQGYARFAVDFEANNFLARRFWLRYFTPVAYSLIRYTDPRASQPQ